MDDLRACMESWKYDSGHCQKAWQDIKEQRKPETVIGGRTLYRKEEYRLLVRTFLSEPTHCLSEGEELERSWSMTLSSKNLEGSRSARQGETGRREYSSPKPGEKGCTVTGETQSGWL